MPAEQVLEEATSVSLTNKYSKSKIDHLKKMQQITALQAIDRLNANMKKFVDENYNIEVEERQRVKNSLLKDI